MGHLRFHRSVRPHRLRQLHLLLFLDNKLMLSNL
jgi:hypothetical protein